MRDPFQSDIHICFTDWRCQFHTTWLSVHVLLTGTTQLLSADMTQRARPCHTDHSVIQCWHDPACTSLSHGALSYWGLTWLSVHVLVTRSTQLLRADMTQRARPFHMGHLVIEGWHDSACTSLSYGPLSYWGLTWIGVDVLVTRTTQLLGADMTQRGRPCHTDHSVIECWRDSAWSSLSHGPLSYWVLTWLSVDVLVTRTTQLLSADMTQRGRPCHTDHSVIGCWHDSACTSLSHGPLSYWVLTCQRGRPCHTDHSVIGCWHDSACTSLSHGPLSYWGLTWLSVDVLVTRTTQLLGADMTQSARPCHTDHSVIEGWHDSAWTSLSHGPLSYWVLKWLSVDVLVTRTTQLLGADMTQRGRPCHMDHSVIGCWHDSAWTSLSHGPLSYWVLTWLSVDALVTWTTQLLGADVTQRGRPCHTDHSVIECWHDSAWTSLSHGPLSYWVLTWLSVDVLVTRTTQLLSADMTQRGRPCHTDHSVIEGVTTDKSHF